MSVYSSTHSNIRVLDTVLYDVYTMGHTKGVCLWHLQWQTYILFLPWVINTDLNTHKLLSC